MEPRRVPPHAYDDRVQQGTSARQADGGGGESAHALTRPSPTNGGACAQDWWGFPLLLRLYGSSMTRTLPFAIMSMLGTLWLNLTNGGEPPVRGFSHPYPFTLYAFIVGFAVVFRTNFAITRYWEGRTQIQILSAELATVAVQLLSWDRQNRTEERAAAAALARKSEALMHANNKKAKNAMPQSGERSQEHDEIAEAKRLHTQAQADLFHIRLQQEEESWFRHSLVHLLSLTHALALQNVRADRMPQNLVRFKLRRPSDKRHAHGAVMTGTPNDDFFLAQRRGDIEDPRNSVRSDSGEPQDQEDREDEPCPSSSLPFWQQQRQTSFASSSTTSGGSTPRPRDVLEAVHEGNDGDDEKEREEAKEEHTRALPAKLNIQQQQSSSSIGSSGSSDDESHCSGEEDSRAESFTTDLVGHTGVVPARSYRASLPSSPKRSIIKPPSLLRQGESGSVHSNRGSGERQSQPPLPHHPSFADGGNAESTAAPDPIGVDDDEFAASGEQLFRSHGFRGPSQKQRLSEHERPEHVRNRVKGWWIGIIKLPCNIKSVMKYNEAFPLPVISGLSNGERELLQGVRVERTYVGFTLLHNLIAERVESGGLSRAPAPVLTRCYAAMDRGSEAYMMARKLADTPFPFPHSQLITGLLVIFAVLTPFMVASFCASTVLSCVFTLAAVWAFWTCVRQLACDHPPFHGDEPLRRFQIGEDGIATIN